MTETVRLLRSWEWLHDNLLERADQPTEYRWADAGEPADITIMLVPLGTAAKQPHRLSRLSSRELRSLYVFNQCDRPVVWAPGVYTSIRASHASGSFAGGFYALPGYLEDRLEDRPVHTETIAPSAEEQDLLWSFVGSVNTYPELRGRIVELRDEKGIARDTDTWTDLRWRPEDDPQRRAAAADYATTVTRSKFVLAPRGVGPSSIRLFEIMRSGRVPVIVSDEWLPPRRIDWSSCAITVAEADVYKIPSLLREREGEAERMGRLAHKVWRENFSQRTMVHHLVHSCLDLHRQRIQVSQRLLIGASGLASRAGISQGRAMTRSAWSGRPRTKGLR